MKSITVLLGATVLLMVGCQYEAPLVREHTIPVDAAALGLWVPVPEEGEESPEDQNMMILKWSDTEYLIHYPAGKDGLYYRAYPIKIGGVECVQLQVIGTKDGPPAPDEKALYYVASYQLKDGGLEIKTLNTDLIGDKLKTTEELQAAFLKHKDSKELFKDPGMFRKAGK